ncbi:hypothetical protein C8R43DRAFT_1009707 [Mycena crocata]|nr:hypothetical protein C8R43DRAFT_1009707 [Mycena crocata]
MLLPPMDPEEVNLLYGLSPSEKKWCKYHSLLDKLGYSLRARYQPDWIPEWVRDPAKHPLFCEDARTPTFHNLLDATRISDGAQMMLKSVDPFTPEGAICLALGRIPDPQNHTIPAEMLIPLSDDPDRAILVMARMRAAYDPPFETVGEVIELFQQILEGVEFMHRHNVAHCDISIRNIVMDTTKMIPGGFHPVWRTTTDGVSQNIHIHSRTEAGPIMYYFIDFGLSVAFPSYEERGTVTGVCGRHKKIPELSEDIPYDPFKLDIRQIGESLKSEFIDKYWGLECLIPLTKLLRKDDPKRRPDASEALRRFNRLVASIDSSVAATRLIPRKGFQPFHWVNHTIIPKAKGFRP